MFQRGNTNIQTEMSPGLHIGGGGVTTRISRNNTINPSLSGVVKTERARSVKKSIFEGVKSIFHPGIKPEGIRALRQSRLLILHQTVNNIYIYIENNRYTSRSKDTTRFSRFSGKSMGSTFSR